MRTVLRDASYNLDTRRLREDRSDRVGIMERTRTAHGIAVGGQSAPRHASGAGRGTLGSPGGDVYRVAPGDDESAGMLTRRLFGVVVAIPAHNEELGIGSVVLRALDHADEVVVVDDGSVDATARVAARAGARVIRHETNGGYGAALRTIFETARLEDWPALAIIDSDGQHNPEDIPDVVEPVLKGEADICIGSRFLEEDDREAIPAYRQIGIKVLTGLNNIGAPPAQRVTDGQCGFRAYSRRAIQAIDPSDDGMGISAEILLQARKAGLSFAEVPIRVRYDVDGSSQHPVKHGLGVVQSLVRFAEIDHPLFFFGFPGLAAFLIGIGLVAFAVSSFVNAGVLLIGVGSAGVAFAILGLVSLSTALTLHAVSVGVRAR